MPDMEVEQQVRDILGTALSMNADRVPLSSNLMDDLGMDSLAAAEIICQLEDEFHFSIDSLAPPPLQTLQDLVNLAELQGGPKLAQLYSQ